MATRQDRMNAGPHSVINGAPSGDLAPDPNGTPRTPESLTTGDPIEGQSILHIPLDRIRVGKHRRPLGPLGPLMDSIRRLGVLEPIALTPDYALVYGRHRVEACRQAGLTTIPAIIVKLDKLNAELAEIEENLIRRELPILELAEHLERRQTLLEAMGKRAPAHRPSKEETVSGLVTTEQLGREMGVTERTIRNYRIIAEQIDEPLRNCLRGTPVANSTRTLLQIAKLDPEDQKRLAQAVGKKREVTDRFIEDTLSGWRTPAIDDEGAVATLTSTPILPETAAGTAEPLAPASSSNGETDATTVEGAANEETPSPAQHVELPDSSSQETRNNQTAQAQRFQVIRDAVEQALDGVAQPAFSKTDLGDLSARMYIDPPSDADISEWLTAVRGIPTIAHLPPRFGELWFQNLPATAFCLPRGSEDGVIACLADDGRAFYEVFAPIGLIVRPLRDPAELDHINSPRVESGQRGEEG